MLMPRICHSGCLAVFDGGFPNAERKLAGFFFEGEEQTFPFKGIKITYSEKIGLLNHRDFLGALLGLGIRRESVGDIAVTEGEAIVLVLEDIVPFILDNLKMVGRAGVRLEMTDDFCYNKEDNVECFQVCVASDRIDAILAAVVHQSREKAVRLLEEGKVRIDHQTVTEKSCCVKGTELLSVTGMGRWKLDGYTGSSKKGRLFLAVKAFV